MNILVLIIAGGSYPQYAEMESIWRKYMFQSKIKCYFIKMKPNIQSNIKVKTDTIYVKGEESLIPGILVKTINAMKCALSGKLGKWDYIVRTNMSSVLNFPVLYKILLENGKKLDYFGSANDGWVEGSCMVLSRRACQYLCDNVDLSSTIIDDVTIGKTITTKYPIIHYPKRDVLSLEELNWVTEIDLQHCFHYRCKSQGHQHTCDIMKELIKYITNYSNKQ